MLDLNKVIKQIKALENRGDHDGSGADLLSLALSKFEEAIGDAAKFEEKLDGSEGTTWWPLAKSIEQFGTICSISTKPPAKSLVVGVDGSQIMPSHHEIYSCFLLNIGVSAITYGIKKAPTLLSKPFLFHRPEDLYPLVDRRRMHIDELYVSLERYLLEFEELAQTAITLKENDMATLALFDGALIPWSLEKMPPTYVDQFIERAKNIYALLRQNKVPVMGYISHSRSSEVVNMLRVYNCPYELSHCRNYCSELNEEDFPCSTIWPLTDRHLFKNSLPANSRGPIFQSSAKMSQLFDAENRICFSYLNVASEVVRLEFPRWLASDKALLEQAFVLTLNQTSKGMGYPIVLTEAHHLAVIKNQERKQFFDLVAKQLLTLGVKRIAQSPKEQKKQTSFV
jgi:hypothetical protein